MEFGNSNKKSFHRLNDAIEFCDSNSSVDRRLHLFSFEVDSGGRRRFLVTRNGFESDLGQ